LNNKENEMKPITKQSDKKTAFTIIELLTVMSIIVILIGLLLPSLNMVKRYAKEVRQRAQFNSIKSALEFFSSASQYDSLPPSEAHDMDDKSYCGAMKLCEAMVGWDLIGFHINTAWRADGLDSAGTDLSYDPARGRDADTDGILDTLKERKEPYLQTEYATACRIGDMYPSQTTFPTSPFVLCDVYNRARNATTGKGVGMPILYYKANTSNSIHDPCGTLPTAWNADGGYIYNYWDNQELVELGIPPAGTATDHPLATPIKFYEITKDNRVSIPTGWPHNPNTYILISAGFDGLYGTNDDIFNFEK
jgi:type II secretory pathway pseudopilin PulG